MVPRVPPVASIALTAAVATAAVVNLPQFVWLELSTGGVYEALRIKDGHGLDELVEQHFESTQLDVGLFTRLRTLAPGATVTVADERQQLMTDLDLVGLALADEVTRPAGPLPTVDEATVAGWEESLAALGEDEDLGPYGIVVGPDPVTSLTVVDGPDRRYLVDERLLDPAVAG